MAELADTRHTSEASATRLVRGHTQWRRQSDNQGHLRVLVPAEALRAVVREDVLEDLRQQDSEAVMTAVAGLIARAERAETEADHHRDRADAAAARAEQAEVRADVAEKKANAADQDRRQAHARADADRRAAETRAAEIEARADGLQGLLEARRQELAEQRALTDRAEGACAEAVRAAEELRQADDAGRARGLVARLRAAWCGE
jgi:hypothetical protein